MTLGDLMALALVLAIFGGSSGLFTFVSTRLLLEKMQRLGFFVKMRDWTTVDHDVRP